MKTLKTLVAGTILMAVPGLAMAQGCDYTTSKQVTQSCAPGTSLDAQTGTCVADATS